MDTIEHAAITLTTHVLHRAGFLVAAPKPDREGTDLLAFMQMADGAKFCRVQVKGRSLRDSDSSVEIPCSYVTNGFLVALYIEDGEGDPGHYCFIPSDVQTWPKTTNQSAYRLGLSKATHRDKLKGFAFDEIRVGLIRILISQAELHNEFRRLVYGAVRISVGAAGTHMTGTVSAPKP
jgi:hypothetical protein